ncbi:MAG: glucose 1-dehydrogenase [Burkholderiales bacterium]|nr:glucose 1-dehydrogenase [Burkholderiales bacterium]
MSFANIHPLAGQKAIVTGANSGIGAAIAQTLAAAGAAVGVNHRGKLAPAQKIVSAIQEQGGEAMALRADVAREIEVIAMFDDFVAAFGRIDILVANAGVQKDAPLATMSIADWNTVIETNLTGQFLCVREAIRRFRAQSPLRGAMARGKIICMSSVHQLIPWAGHVNYAASKGGIEQMMRSVAQEVAADKIRVNAIAPGAIKTEINREAWETPEAEQKLLQLIPYGRLGETGDVAKAAIWLASDESDYVTGTTLFVDGAMSLYPAFRDNG